MLRPRSCFSPSYLIVFIIALTTLSAAEHLTLPSGLPVKIVMPHPVTFNTARVGTNINWNVAEDVMIGEYIVIRRGATARAKVDTAIDQGSRPRITLKMQFVELASGQRALLRASETPYDRRADSLDFYGSGIVTHTKHNTVIAEGHELTVYIDESIRVDAQVLTSRGAIVGYVPDAKARPDSDTLTVADGTPIELRLAQSISSEDADVGDRVDFQVINEIRVGNLVVIPKGATVWATVTEAKKKRTMGRAGKLALTIDYVGLVTGEKLPLRADKEKKGDEHKKAMTGAMAATTVVAWPLAPVWLMLEGEETAMKKGMGAEAYVDGNFTLDPQRWGYAPVVLPQPQAIQAAASTVNVDISSTPAGAEIYIDSVYVGHSPSTVGMTQGTHVILLKKRGFRSWSRSMSISSGKVSVVAELQRLTRAR
jgi:hypothetical protein